jgi:hypothetical protein
MTSAHTIEQLNADNEAFIDEDAAIDRFHAGYDAHWAGQPCPTEKDAAEGWKTRDREGRVQVVMPARPEGYYHMPLGTFE